MNILKVCALLALVYASSLNVASANTCEVVLQQGNPHEYFAQRYQGNGWVSLSKDDVTMLADIAPVVFPHLRVAVLSFGEDGIVDIVEGNFKETVCAKPRDNGECAPRMLVVGKPLKNMVPASNNGDAALLDRSFFGGEVVDTFDSPVYEISIDRIDRLAVQVDNPVIFQGRPYLPNHTKLTYFQTGGGSTLLMGRPGLMQDNGTQFIGQKMVYDIVLQPADVEGEGGLYARLEGVLMVVTNSTHTIRTADGRTVSIIPTQHMIEGIYVGPHTQFRVRR